MPYDSGGPVNGNWFEQSDVDAAKAKQAALMEQFRNRGVAPAGWQWQSQFTPANNSLFGEDSVQGDSNTPYRVLQETGDAGSWWAGGGSPMNYANYDPTTQQFTNQEYDAGSGWSYRDLAKIAAMAAAGGALNGAEAGAEGAGAGYGAGGATEPVASIGTEAAAGAAPVAAAGAGGMPTLGQVSSGLNIAKVGAGLLGIGGIGAAAGAIGGPRTIGPPPTRLPPLTAPTPFYPDYGPSQNERLGGLLGSVQPYENSGLARFGVGTGSSYRPAPYVAQNFFGAQVDPRKTIQPVRRGPGST